MSGGVNRVTLVGNLGQDPELRHTQAGQAVCNMSLATSRSWVDGQGQRQERVEWHRIVVWGKVAESCARYLTKGRQVYIEGELQTRDWEDRDGNKRYTTEIVAREVQFLQGGQQRQQQSGAQPPAGAPAGGPAQGYQPPAPAAPPGPTSPQGYGPAPGPAPAGNPYPAAPSGTAPMGTTPLVAPPQQASLPVGAPAADPNLAVDPRHSPF